MPDPVTIRDTGGVSDTEVWVKEHADGTWWVEGARNHQINDGWEGIAAFVEAGLTVHWDSPESTERFTVALGDPSEI